MENEKYVIQSPTKMYSIEFSLLSCSGKILKISWKCQGKLREFDLLKMWPPCCLDHDRMVNSIKNT